LEKVKELYPDLKIDTNLRGTHSWTYYDKVKNFPVELFRFGKYTNSPISEVVKTDLKYVLWYRDNVHAEARDYINNLPEVVAKLESDRLAAETALSEYAAELKMMPALRAGCPITLSFNSNPNRYVGQEFDGYYVEELSTKLGVDADTLISRSKFAYATISGYTPNNFNLTVRVIFSQVKEVYGMYPYTMGVIDGKPMKVRGKQFSIVPKQVWEHTTLPVENSNAKPVVYETILI
jgi:hypothetical protein